MSGFLSINPRTPMRGVGLIGPDGVSLYRLTFPPMQGILKYFAKSVSPLRDSKNVQKISGSSGFPNCK